MRSPAVSALIRRRGNIISWQHATPASGAIVDEDTREPRLNVGGARIAMGPTGESYGVPYACRGYFSTKTAAIFAQLYGMQDERDAQLDVAVPFAPEPEYGIVLPAPADYAAWNTGTFTQFAPNPMPAATLTLIARDRFVINGVRFIVKVAAVPIQDANVTVAWRILLGADTF